MALVLILAMIVLVTIAVMAFFTHATANRQVEASRSNQIEADQLAQSGADYVTGLYLREASAAKVLPARAIGANILTDTNFVNLIRQSVVVSGSSADTNVSSQSTTDASRNGRSISLQRWNAPVLLNGGGFTAANQLPNWVYVTRSGGLTSTPSADVIGRFAYNVYDIGGLLNANVAGYSGVTNATNVSRLKFATAGADLTVLSIPTNAIADLNRFRNSGAVAGSDREVVDRASAFTKTGFLGRAATNATNTSQIFTNNAFANRQDLLRYARTQNTPLTNALPYLTHFARTRSAPSWMPTNVTAVNPSFSAVTFPSDKANVVHYFDDGTTESYNALQGDPAMQRKFSLAKLAWLGPDGPNKSAFAAEVAGNTTKMNDAIRACFGMEWNTAEERWDYVAGEVDAAGDTRYKTLATVASEGREPNLMEVLSASIARDTMGFNFELAQGASMPSATAFSAETDAQNQTWHEYWRYIGSANTQALLANAELNILRIAASMVDSADADNYPTIFSFPIAGNRVEQAGVEDLPYLYCIMTQGLANVEMPVRQADGSYTPGKLYNQDVVWVPIFLNPHRASASTVSGQPDYVRMQFSSGTLTRADINGAGAIYAQNSVNRSFSGLSTSLSQGPIDIPSSMFAAMRTGPQAMMQEVGPGDKGDNNMGELVSYEDPLTGHSSNAASEFANLQGFRIFSWHRDYTGSGWVAATATSQKYLTVSSSWLAGVAPFLYFQDVNMVMRYKTPSGTKWRTYQTLGGSANYLNSGLNGARQDGVSQPTQVLRSGRHYNASMPCHDFLLTYNIVAPDPRTSRGGPFSVRAWAFDASGRMQLPQTDGAIQGFYPEAGKGPTGRGTAGAYTPTNFRDKDSVYRPADGYMSSSVANIYSKFSGNSLNATWPARPMVLQRPFETVGELGHVFRDQMWKSLNFFDESSGDRGLLDVFAVSDTAPIDAGRVSLNSRQPLVIQSLIAGIGRDQSGLDPFNSAAPNYPKKIADALQSYSFTSSAPTASIPSNVGDLAAFMSSPALTNSVYTTANESIKYRREAIVRSLADSTQTSTWNVLIDVIAQVGKFPANSGSFASGAFVVEAEKRKWVSVAVDRFRGDIVDQQTEDVNE